MVDVSTTGPSPRYFVESYIGVYSDHVQGENAGLRRLAEEIARHPEADVFIIRRTDVFFAVDEIEWWKTIYVRRERTLVDGNGIYGDSEYWGKVTDEMIGSVARHSCGFFGFSKASAVDLRP